MSETNSTITTILLGFLLALICIGLGYSINTKDSAINRYEYCFKKDMNYTNRVSMASSTTDQRLWSFRSCAWILGDGFEKSIMYHNEIDKIYEFKRITR